MIYVSLECKGCVRSVDMGHTPRTTITHLEPIWSANFNGSSVCALRSRTSSLLVYISGFACDCKVAYFSTPYVAAAYRFIDMEHLGAADDLMTEV